ncbi:hypothetical protein GCM10011446_03510 [Acinetobacter vivianii]|nr:hypothetical protein GCM10011446_03510 [Acinetobacter vivianii]
MLHNQDDRLWPIKLTNFKFLAETKGSHNLSLKIVHLVGKEANNKLVDLWRIYSL